MEHIIKAILPPKRPNGKTVVVFEDGRTRKYLPQTVQDQGLYPGRCLSESELSALEEANSALSAKQRAVRIISASAVSKGDLQRRLTQKGENPEDAKNAVDAGRRRDCPPDRLPGCGPGLRRGADPADAL